MAIPVATCTWPRRQAYSDFDCTAWRDDRVEAVTLSIDRDRAIGFGFIWLALAI